MSKPFEVQLDQATLDDLKQRLAQTRWPDQVRAAGWEYGTELGYLRELAAYWQNDFDWRAQERRINAFEQFRAEIDGFGIHFIHQRGKGSNPLPVVMLHGWPSSFVQMLKIIPLLTDPAAHGGDAADSFDVVVPSLPGYGFSDRPSEAGMSVARCAQLIGKLMSDELGYGRYALRGSDLGAGVIQQLVAADASKIIGRHESGTNPYIGEVPDDLSPAEQEFVEQAQQWTMQEMAYAMLQSSKPQTLAYGLNDSPAGLAAWIVEKFRRWSDCDGDVEKRFSKDELLTNLTIYWATQTIGSSVRLYYETARDAGNWGGAHVPSAIIMPSKDMFPTPREWLERNGPIERWTPTDRGGHFLEWEEPELVAQDMREFFRPLRGSEKQAK